MPEYRIVAALVHTHTVERIICAPTAGKAVNSVLDDLEKNPQELADFYTTISAQVYHIERISDVDHV